MVYTHLENDGGRWAIYIVERYSMCMSVIIYSVSLIRNFLQEMAGHSCAAALCQARYRTLLYTSLSAVRIGVSLMNVVQEISRINERELEQGLSGKASWHHEYKDSAWVFVGGFPYDLTEGDLLCFMSQWGEIEDINLCREKETGKSKVRTLVCLT